MPGQDFTLARFTLADGVDPEFAKHKRLGIGERLQPREIILKRFLLVQVNIKADKVDALRMEKFRRWKGSERAQAIRINGLGHIHQFLDKIRHRADAAPAHDLRGNLVDHAVGEDRAVALAGQDGFSHCVTRLRS